MSAQLEVILTDRGGSQQPQPASGAGEPSRAPFERTPGPRDQVTGPRKTAERSTAGTGADGALKAAEILANVFGAGGLFNVSKQLADSFAQIYRAVTKATAAHDDNARAVQDATRQSRRPDIVGPRRPAPPDVIDAEFEVKGPQPGLVPTGPTRNAGATASGGGLIKAPQPLSTDHAKTRVDTVDVKGPKDVAVDAAILGPLRSFKNLSETVGPAAAAIATLTAAAVAGGAAIKRVADSLDSEAKRLSNLSPQLAAQTSFNDIRLLFADLRRANQVGPQLARFENRYGRAQEALADAQTEVLRALLKIEDEVSGLTELAIQLVQTSAKYGPQIAEGVLNTVKIANPKLGAIATAVAFVAKVAQRWAKDKEKEEQIKEDPFMQAFLGAFAEGDPIRRDRAAAVAMGRVP